MDSYILSGVFINLIFICIGGYLAMRGKALKDKNSNQPMMASSNAMIIIGILIMSVNTLQIAGFG